MTKRNYTKISRDLKHLETLFKVAQATEPVSGASVAASIVIGNEVIAFGKNSRKTHPLQKKYSKNADAICLHAEIDVIARALREVPVDDLRKSTLYIARFKKTYVSHNNHKATWGYVEPCNGCKQAITAFRISRVVYTCDGIGNYEELVQ